MSIGAAGILIAANGGMNARRQTIIERSFLEQRRNRIAHCDNAGSEHHRRLFRKNPVDNLHCRLRACLIVMEIELDGLAAGAAFLIDRCLEDLKRLLFTLSQERRSTCQRQNDVYFVWLNGAGARRGDRRGTSQDRGSVEELVQDRHGCSPNTFRRAPVTTDFVAAALLIAAPLVRFPPKGN